MNNQKITKLSEKDHEIATLKKGNNYLLERVKQQASDLADTNKELKTAYSDHSDALDRLEAITVELTKIKSHWLYKLINWFKKYLWHK
jgi:DNA repair exonuclease SbcCD ATPase subunit